MPGDKLNGTVEADETYVGGVKRRDGRRYTGNKTAVVSLVERRVRSQVVDKVTGDALGTLLKQHVAETAHLNTDEAPVYRKPGDAFASHDVVNHRREEYARRTFRVASPQPTQRKASSATPSGRWTEHIVENSARSICRFTSPNWTTNTTGGNRWRAYGDCDSEDR